MKSRLVNFPARKKARVVAMGILIRSRFRWHIGCVVHMRGTENTLFPVIAARRARP